MLPDGLFALFQPRCVGCASESIRTMLGEPGFDQASADGKVSIIRRQSPDAMKIIRHDDDCIDFKRTRRANGSEGIAQGIDGFVRSQNGAAAIRHKSEEEGATGNDGASILHGECRVTLR